MIPQSLAYYPIEQLLKLIDTPNTEPCRRLYVDNLFLFSQVQGSTNNHQAWQGGYHDHVQEVMNIAYQLFWTLNNCRPLQFTLSDLLLVVFLHDIEKPWKYEFRDGELHHRPGMETKADHQAYRLKKLAEYGITLTPEQENGLEYAEGEINNYSSRKRMMGPLAAVAHMCDVASARLWHDHPLHGSDPWVGANRIRELGDH